MHALRSDGKMMYEALVASVERTCESRSPSSQRRRGKSTPGERTTI